ncbi:MAG: DUF1802 family protein [Egibacteraceae bacterium]
MPHVTAAARAVQDDAAAGALGSSVESLALKEWGAVAHGLLDGRQTILLRKGGIHERRFEVAASRGEVFVLFPTVAHSHAERVRPEHVDLLGPGAADVADDRVTVRCGVRLIAAVAVARPGALPALADLHIWTQDSVRADRLDFRPKHVLHALVVEAVALPDPVTLPRVEAYGGCRSWLHLPLAWDGRTGRTVHDASHLDAIAARLRATVG